jgi:hypothetical protein
MKMPKFAFPAAPVSPFVRRTAAQWKPGSFAHHPPAEPESGYTLERPHEHVPSGKGARNTREGG